jgi:hypothetical protein
MIKWILTTTLMSSSALVDKDKLWDVPPAMGSVTFSGFFLRRVAHNSSVTHPALYMLNVSGMRKGLPLLNEIQTVGRLQKTH